MKNVKLYALALLFSAGFTACNQSGGNGSSDQSSDKDKKEKLVSDVMTKEDQQKLTPEAALEDLMEGNKRYMNNNLINRDLPAQMEATATGQFPKAVILSCIDSRVPVEKVFDQGVGDIFVARVAGNVEDQDLLGSMEYGLGVAGSKLLMVLGHESCGAVKSAIDQVDVGSSNVDHLLSQVEPAISATEGKRDSKNANYVESVVKNNVTQTIEDIRKRSDIIRQLEAGGKIKIVGAYYDLNTGKVTIVE